MPSVWRQCRGPAHCIECQEKLEQGQLEEARSEIKRSEGNRKPPSGGFLVFEGCSFTQDEHLSQKSDSLDQAEAGKDESRRFAGRVR